jgi:hypothetical protein
MMNAVFVPSRLRGENPCFLALLALASTLRGDAMAVHYVSTAILISCNGTLDSSGNLPRLPVDL